MVYVYFYNNNPSCDMERIENAVLAVKRDQLTISKATQKFGVSTILLRSRLKKDSKKNVSKKKAIKKQPRVKVRRIPPPISFFSAECETSLAEYLERCNGMFYGVSADEVRGLAFDFGKQMKLDIPWSWEKLQMADRDWLRRFRRRHNDLTQRNSGKAYMTVFTTNFLTVVNAECLTASRIWSMGETGITMMQSKNYVVTKRTTAVACDSLVTMALTMSAIGQYLPPFFIFPCENFGNHLLKSGPTGSGGVANPNCWMDSVHFYEYLKFFRSHVHASRESPVLIVLENHKSHLSVAVIDFCEANGILLLSHKYSRAKLLDHLSIKVPWNTIIDLLCEKRSKTYPDKKLTMQDIPRVVKAALPLVFTDKNIIASFERADIAKCISSIQLDTNTIDSKERDCLPSIQSEHFDTTMLNVATIETERTDSLKDEYLCYGLKSHIKEEPPLDIVDVAGGYTTLWQKEVANELMPKRQSPVNEEPTVEIVDESTGYTTLWQKVDANASKLKCTCLLKNENVNEEPTVEIFDVDTGYNTVWQKVVSNTSKPLCLCVVKDENITEVPNLRKVKVEDIISEQKEELCALPTKSQCSVNDNITDIAAKPPEYQQVQQSKYIDNVKSKIEKLSGITLQPARAREQNKNVITKQSCTKLSDVIFQNTNMPDNKLRPCLEELKNKIKKLPGLKFQTTRAQIQPLENDRNKTAEPINVNEETLSIL